MESHAVQRGAVNQNEITEMSLLTASFCVTEGRVVFVTGGAGTICSMQTRALVRLGANACIIGRNVEKTEEAARDIATVRPGAKVIGIGGCDVRKVSFSSIFGCVSRERRA